MCWMWLFWRIKLAKVKRRHVNYVYNSMVFQESVCKSLDNCLSPTWLYNCRSFCLWTFIILHIIIWRCLQAPSKWIQRFCGIMCISAIFLEYAMSKHNHRLSSLLTQSMSFKIRSKFQCIFISWQFWTIFIWKTLSCKSNLM